jgi:hypothetical protein
VPPAIEPDLTHFFYTEVLAFLQPRHLTETDTSFFPENNQL